LWLAIPIKQFTAQGNPNLVRELAHRSDVRTIPLSLNYRCCQRIIDTAETVLEPGNLRGHRSNRNDERGAIHIEPYTKGLDHQIGGITDDIIPALTARKCALGDIAILCRNQEVAGRVANGLQQAGIPCSGEGDQRYERTPMTRWLENLAAWAEGGWTDSRPRFDNLYSTYRDWLRANRFYVPPEKRLGHRTNFSQVLLRLRNPRMLVSEWLAGLHEGLALHFLLTQMNETSPRDVKAFNGLLKAAGSHGRLSNMRVADLARCGRSSDSIFLATLHASKGLEFDAVIIPDMEEGRLPDYRARTPAEINEERRLLYVGISRARYEVYLLHSGWYRVARNGRVFENGRSRFFDELENL
jgi:DNA helicase-2/ATP-dependent DNA helicase PcrA